jgi:hypothetical protein
MIKVKWYVLVMYSGTSMVLVMDSMIKIIRQ